MQQYVLLYAWDCLLAVKFTSLERSVYLSHNTEYCISINSLVLSVFSH